MKLLAIDTASEACSAALLLGDTLLTRSEVVGRGHAERILPMIDQLLGEAGRQLKDLDCIAVGRGPGAFTGVRIAVSVAQGLAFGAGLPVMAVSDLAALAQRAADLHRTGVVLACMDARMGEVYWANFALQSDGLVALIGQEQVDPPDAVQKPLAEQWMGAGTGWGAYPALSARLGASSDATLLPRAAEIARLGARDCRAGLAVSPELAQPVYLRDRVAWAGPKS